MTIETYNSEQLEMKSLAVAYFRRIDSGEQVTSLFHPNAQVYLPRSPIATGHDEITALFQKVRAFSKKVCHFIEFINYAIDGDIVAAEGITSGLGADGSRWFTGAGGIGRFCNVFEIRQGLIQRCHVYLNADTGGARDW